MLFLFCQGPCPFSTQYPFRGNRTWVWRKENIILQCLLINNLGAHSGKKFLKCILYFRSKYRNDTLFKINKVTETS